MRIILLFSIFICFSLNSTAQDTVWICLPPWWPLDHQCCWDQLVNFDNSFNPIFIDSISGNLWQIGSTTKFNLIASPYKRSLCTDTLNHYPINNYSTFRITIIGNFYPYSELSFIHKIDTDQGRDGGKIVIYNRHEKKWQNLIESSGLIWEEYNFYTTTDTVTALNGKPGFSGSSDWEEVRFGFHCDGLDTINLKFVFASDSIDDQKDGWIIDNFYIISDYEGISQAIDNPIKIFPNPFCDMIQIQNNGSTILLDPTITISDIFGKIRYKIVHYDYSTINLNELEPGIYLVKTNDGYHTNFQKIIKLRQ